jgi:Ala-tRNA(Pro) deacylase
MLISDWLRRDKLMSINALPVLDNSRTPLSLSYEKAGAVTSVVDISLLNAEQVSLHPLINIESTGVRPADLLTFIRSCDRESMLVDFDIPPENG